MGYFRVRLFNEAKGIAENLKKSRHSIKIIQVMGSITDLINEILGLVNSLLSSLGIALPVGGL